MSKLTKAQIELLRLASADGGRRPSGNYYPPGTACVSYYKPALKMIEAGLARWLRDNPETGRLISTDAGREALRKQS